MGDASQRVQQNLETVNGKSVVHRNAIIQLKEVDPLHGALLQVLLGELFGAIEAKPL